MLEWLTPLASATALLVGGVYLVLWLAGVPPRWSAGGVVTMKANMALAQVMAAAALLVVGHPRDAARWRTFVTAGLAILVLLTGALTLAEHLTRLDLGFDQLLAAEPPGQPATASPNRMGPPGALALTLLGVGLLALAFRRRIAVGFGVVVCCIVLVPAVGFLYDIGELHRETNVTAIAWPAVIALLSLGVGLAFAHPHDATAPLAWRDDPGGLLLRRMLLPAVLLPIVLGFVRLAGERLGLYQRHLGTGLFAISLVVLLLLFLWRSAERLSAAAVDRARADRRAREALHKVNEKLRDADRRKDEFLGILSHELRNPLAPIRNSVYLLERAAPGSEQAQRAKVVIRRQTEHLTRLVDDLLDVTRIARGKVELRRTDLDLRDVVARAVEDHRALLTHRGIALDVETPRDPVLVLGDPTRLAQIVGNLLQNAAKFTNEGGRVAVSVERSGRAAEVRVRDTGAGIEPALAERLFEPFTQAKQTLARSEGGLGLGLALVKGLVELHGGTVGVASDGPGHGSEFTVRLPLAEPPLSIEARPAAAPGGRRHRYRVLVVDDNEDAAESLAELVKHFGHEVEIAYDGPTAIEKASAHRPDVVLCDLGLPGMDGFEVARALRARHVTATLLVAVSGYAQPEDIQKARDSGFDAHLAKPPDPDRIEQLLA